MGRVTSFSLGGHFAKFIESLRYWPGTNEDVGAEGTTLVNNRRINGRSRRRAKSEARSVKRSFG